MSDWIPKCTTHHDACECREMKHANDKIGYRNQIHERDQRIMNLEDANTEHVRRNQELTSYKVKALSEMLRFKDGLQRVLLREENEGRPNSFIANICKGALGVDK